MEQPLSPGLTTGETENEPVLAPKGTHSCLDILCHPRTEGLCLLCGLVMWEMNSL